MDGAPYLAIEALLKARECNSDEQIIEELRDLPPLKDEDDPAWEDPDYWNQAYLFVALGKLVGLRRLRQGIPLLLERACLGDPGEIMRGLRHALEAAANGDGALLAELCIAAARSPRAGTRLWAIDQLVVLDDQRARGVFEQAIMNATGEIPQRAQVGVARLSAGAA
jgi:hypothetical protein